MKYPRYSVGWGTSLPDAIRDAINDNEIKFGSAQVKAEGSRLRYDPTLPPTAHKIRARRKKR